MKNFTRASLKKFIRENKDTLAIMKKSNFSGMSDCVEQIDNPQFIYVNPNNIDFNKEYDFGIDGLYLVGQCRDYFTQLSNNEIQISNCCGHCILKSV